MSPEQVRGLPLDRRSDIFAAGVVLYELCTGERLFTGSSDYSVLEKVQQAKITAPSELVRDIPDRLDRVILKALAREPENRYQHAADLAQDLMRFLIESHTRVVSRDDVAAFMKAVFPDDDARERRGGGPVLDPTRTGVRRPEPAPDSVRTDQPEQRQHHHEPRLREPPKREPVAAPLPPRQEPVKAPPPAPKRAPAAAAPPPAPPASRIQKSAPPKLPASLIAGIDLAAEDGNELTPRARPERELLPTDPGGASGAPQKTAPPLLAPQAARPPPIPAQPAAPVAPKTPGAAPAAIPAAPAKPGPVVAPKATVTPDGSRAQENSGPRPSVQGAWTRRDEDERTEPRLFMPPVDDEPTRPMSMRELAEAERILIRARARAEPRQRLGAGRDHRAGRARREGRLGRPGRCSRESEPGARGHQARLRREAPAARDHYAQSAAPRRVRALAAPEPSARAAPAHAARRHQGLRRRFRAPNPGGASALLPFSAERSDDMTPSARLRRGEPLQAKAPRSGSFPAPRPEESRAPYGGRMQVAKPTIIGNESLAARRVDRLDADRARALREVRKDRRHRAGAARRRLGVALGAAQEGRAGRAPPSPR